MYGQANVGEQINPLCDEIHFETVEVKSSTWIQYHQLPLFYFSCLNRNQWMKWINKRSIEEVYALLVVVLYKTSFPLYNIQKGRLKDEPFPVVIDKNGETLKRIGITGRNLRMLTVDNSLQILENQSGTYSEQKARVFMDQLKARQ